MQAKVNARDQVAAGLVMRPGFVEILEAPRFTYAFECLDLHGRVKWRDSFQNLVTTEGKNELLDQFFKGSGYTAAWFLGLKGTGTALAADTLASHASWAEVNPYAGNRKAITFGTSAAGSNTATVVAFAITGTATVAGGFVANVNTGTGGKLYSAGDFSVSRSVVNGDTLNVTLTVLA